eukprot:scaffold12187_cov135-Isochrysis_galbana.AAC.1
MSNIVHVLCVRVIKKLTVNSPCVNARIGRHRAALPPHCQLAGERQLKLFRGRPTRPPRCRTTAQHVRAGCHRGHGPLDAS